MSARVSTFDPKSLRLLYKAPDDSNGEDNGQLTIIGGSKLFHGAPIFALKAASSVVDMVFFASPEKSMRGVADQIKASLSSFIWVPWRDVESYIKKSDAILIGPGFMRYGSEKVPEHRRHLGKEGTTTRNLTKKLLQKYPNKKWVIDAGSLQTIDPSWIPQGAIITPNKKEFEMLFDTPMTGSTVVLQMAAKHRCVIVCKGKTTIVSDGSTVYEITGGNGGLTKGGTGDTQAGLTAALFAKNDALLCAASAAYIVKKTGENLAQTVGNNYNADTLASSIFAVLHGLIGG